MTRVLERPQTDAERRERREFTRANYSWRVSSEAYTQLLRQLQASS